MEPVTEFKINLFADEMPPMNEIEKLSDFINAGEINLLTFSEQVEANITKPTPKNLLALGIGLFIIGRNAEAVEKLQKAKDCREKFTYLAYAHRKLKNFDEAVKNLNKTLEYGADTLNVNLEKAATYLQAGSFDAAAKELKACANFENISAGYHYQLGRLQELQGQYEEAVKNYKTALELSPNYQHALFNLAYRYDLAGDEEAAIDYYKQIVSTSPVYVNALLNLAVLYEDKSQCDKAEQCVDKVLEYHPNHKRAIMFKKDIESSKTMVYDEEKEKKKIRKTQILETPISDFELSVRSRNCLKKMNINTLGDLLNISEVELLSYKNFGETSLREIKDILESRGMHLGMTIEEKPSGEILLHSTIEKQDTGTLNRTIDDLLLSVRAKRCMEKLNIRTLGELLCKTEAELLGCKNFGVTSLNEIKRGLAKYGLSLRTLE
jgi:DNA-directed RNA polymerase subunit alpha